MRVSELTGPLLDYWVARAIGIDARVEYHPTNPPKPIACWPMVDGAPSLDKQFSPSTDWQHGGPLIEPNKIGIWPGTEARPLSQLWSANIPGENGIFDDAREQVGFTPLEAAMRALVANKFGEEVSDDPTP